MDEEEPHEETGGSQPAPSLGIWPIHSKQNAPLESDSRKPTREYDIFHNTKHHRIVTDSRFFPTNQPTNQRRPHDIYKIIISIWDPRKSPDFLVHMEVSYKDTMGYYWGTPISGNLQYKIL